MATRTQENVDAYRGNLFTAGRNKLGQSANNSAAQAVLAAANAEYTAAVGAYNAIIASGSSVGLDAAELRVTAAEKARNDAATALAATSTTAVNNAFTWAGQNYATVEGEFYNQLLNPAT